MHFPKMEEFLMEVLHYIKYPFDKIEIRSELESHIMDRIDYYIELGHDAKAAELLALQDMGDSKEIGKELNKQHNPFLGWIFTITKVMLVLFVIVDVYFVGAHIIFTFSGTNMLKEIPKSDILYRIDLNLKVKLDDTVIKFKHLVYEKNGDMNIIYDYYDTRLWGTGWGSDPIHTISDNLGNIYFTGGSQSSGGIVRHCIFTFNNFSADADTLIISYDMYNRNFKVEIPLRAGEQHE
jgi:hypothetical protein